MLTPMDDYLAHQIPETFDRVFTSDRNFYDRYYFNVHDLTGDFFLVVGMGQYPNLGVTDAFAVLSTSSCQTVLRSSRELGGDRLNTTVGPISVEVVEGLKRLKVRCESNETNFSFELEFEGDIPAFLEPETVNRHMGRVISHTQRITQTGAWSGSLTRDGITVEARPDTWKGARDHSWGIRPVGEPEALGIRAAHNEFNGHLHNWAPIQMDDYTILYFIGEDADGRRNMDEAVRVYRDAARGHDILTPCRHELKFEGKSTRIESATLFFTEPSGAELVVEVEPLQPIFMSAGTGYGNDEDWRHGMYQGPSKVESREYDLTDPAVVEAATGLQDTLSRFRIGDRVGYGVFESAVRGPFPRYGF
jgi:hypothetical protein